MLSHSAQVLSTVDQRARVVGSFQEKAHKLAEQCDQIIVRAFETHFPETLRAEVGLVLLACGSYARKQQIVVVSDADLQFVWTKKSPDYVDDVLLETYEAACIKFRREVVPQLLALGISCEERFQNRCPEDLKRDLIAYDRALHARPAEEFPTAFPAFKIFVETINNAVSARVLSASGEYNPVTELQKLVADPGSFSLIVKALTDNIQLCLGEHGTLATSSTDLKNRHQRAILQGTCLITLIRVAGRKLPDGLLSVEQELRQYLEAANVFREIQDSTTSGDYGRTAADRKILRSEDCPKIRQALKQAYQLPEDFDGVAWYYENATRAEFVLKILTVWAQNGEDQKDPFEQPIFDSDPFSKLGKVAPALRERFHYDHEYLPAVSQLIGLPDRQAYQRFSLYEHSIRAVEVLDRLARGFEQDERFVGLYAAIPEESRKVLYLATLLHDCGKREEFRSGSQDPYLHAVFGGELARQVAESLGFSIPEQKLVAQLITNHLWLKDIAKNSLYTIHTTVKMALPPEMQNHDFINMLILLTYADIQTTNPENWNILRANHLYEAGHAAHLQIAGKTKQYAIDVFVKELWDDYSTRLEDCDRGLATAMLDSLPLAFRELPRESLCDFIQMHARYEGNQLFEIVPHNLNSDRADSLYKADVLMLAPDRRFLASQLIQVLSDAGFSIYSADFFTNSDGVAYNRVTIHHGSDRTYDLPRIKMSLAKLFVDVDQQGLPESKLKKLPKESTRVMVQSHPFLEDPSILTLQIKTQNNQGVFLRMLIAFNRVGLELHSCVATTEGESVENLFELRTINRQPITSALSDWFLAAITKDLVELES